MGDYNEGKNNVSIDDNAIQANIDQKEKLLASDIDALSKCNGAMITLSFHVFRDNEVRVYLYNNGQCIRFMPNDIIDLLPIFFNKSEENIEFTKSEAAKKLANIMMDNVRDIHFDAFLQKYQPD